MRKIMTLLVLVMFMLVFTSCGGKDEEVTATADPAFTATPPATLTPPTPTPIPGSEFGTLGEMQGEDGGLPDIAEGIEQRKAEEAAEEAVGETEIPSAAPIDGTEEEEQNETPEAQTSGGSPKWWHFVLSIGGSAGILGLYFFVIKPRISSSSPKTPRPSHFPKRPHRRGGDGSTNL